MTPHQPAALIFDYGHVLCRPQPASELAAMAAIFDLPGEVFEPMYWRYRVPYDESQLEPDQYWRTVARDASRSLTPDQIERLIDHDNKSWSLPDQQTVAWARKVRDSGMKTAILSNMPMPLRQYLKGCSWLPEVDSATYSCDVRLTKPGRAIYDACLTALGVPAQEVLFFDDRVENVAAARQAGWHAVQFTTLDETLATLNGAYQLPPLS